MFSVPKAVIADYSKFFTGFLELRLGGHFRSLLTITGDTDANARK